MLTLLGGALALTGCGGGGDASNASVAASIPDVGAGGAVADPAAAGAGAATADKASGAIGALTGFGSIIVNGSGVHIDDSSATVTDQNGNDMTGNLKLGMQVVVTSTTAASGAVTAQSVVVGGELQGRVENIVAGISFEVLGQTVIVLGSTVFDSTLANGFASLALDDIVEVHGYLDAKKNELTASYVQLLSWVPKEFKILGEVKLTTANKLEIGSKLKVDYSMITDVPVDGALMRVRVNGVAPPTAVPAEWTGTSISGLDNLTWNCDLFEIEARISAFTSAAAFSVNGLLVDASGTGVVVINPLSTALAAGVRVEVKGKLNAGTLTATQIKVKSEAELNARQYELSGAISAFSGNAAAGSFMIKGQTVNFAVPGASFPNGVPASLADGVSVTVKGAVSTVGGAGSQVAAASIRYN